MKLATSATIVALLTIGVIRWPSPTEARGESATRAQAPVAVEIPTFQWDPAWSKTMPNNWMLGATIGAHVDSRDHIWIVHRSFGNGTGAPSAYQAAADQTPPVAECCRAAPPVVEFDRAGNLVQGWGGPGSGYEWPEGEHGIFVDHKDNVWIGSNFAGQRGGSSRISTQVLKFTRQGKFLLQIGKEGVLGTNDDHQNMKQPTGIWVDAATNEAFVADGELQDHRRVIVFDADTGAYKRHWGAYGNTPMDGDLGRYAPGDKPEQFRGPHCVRMSRDGLLYVCDRFNDRLQVFRKDGTFVKEIFVAPSTLYPGSVYDVAFSPDAEQKSLYVADGMNKKVWILLRESLEVLDRFGVGGNFGGQFNHPHSIAADSAGNLYVTETLEGKRVQKFTFTGMKTAVPLPPPPQPRQTPRLTTTLTSTRRHRQ